MINPTDEQKKTYQVLHDAQQLAISALKPGVPLRQVYEQVSNKIKELNLDLSNKTPLVFGYGIGLEFRESILAINAKNEKEIEDGMAFNVYVAVESLKTNSKEYAIYIGDTVVVRNGGNEIVTAEISKAYKNITYSLQTETN